MKNIFIDSLHHSLSLCREISGQKLTALAPYPHNGSSTARVLEKIRQQWEQEFVELDEQSSEHAASIERFLNGIHAVETTLRNRLEKAL